MREIPDSWRPQSGYIVDIASRGEIGRLSLIGGSLGLQMMQTYSLMRAGRQSSRIIESLHKIGGIQERRKLLAQTIAVS